MEAFLGGDEATTAFCLDDDDYATLQNYIVELEEKLVLQKELLEKKTNETAEFIATISHQLKTPLAGIRLYCEMDHAPHEKKQLVLIEQMEHHIKSLLTLEKFRANAYTLEFARHPLKELVESAWDQLQPLYGGIRLRVNGDEPLRCDRYWLSEAFLNIFKNACESKDRAGEINVNIFRQQSSVFVETEDTGGGVREEELARIFTRFARLNKENDAGGVGLGLAITKAIAEKHHAPLIAGTTASGLKISFLFPDHQRTSYDIVNSVCPRSSGSLRAEALNLHESGCGGFAAATDRPPGAVSSELFAAREAAGREAKSGYPVKKLVF